MGTGARRRLALDCVGDTRAFHQGQPLATFRPSNRRERFALPAGTIRLAYSAEVSVSALADEQAWDATETPIDELPDALLRWVMPSRFCQPDELGSDAWRIFGSVEPGWARVQAVCDFVNGH